MRAMLQAAATGVVLLVTVALAATAFAQGERATLSMPFKATTPSTPTGLDMDLRYFHPEGRDRKPPAIRRLAIHLPEGTTVDPSALPACEATNEEFQAQGRDACPPETKVGEGKLWVYVGAPGDPQETDVVLYNGPDQLIELILFEGTNNTAALERLAIEGRTLSANPAQVPPAGPHEARFAASRIVWDIPPNGRYLVTPPVCPGDGLWRTAGEFEFADGGTASYVATQACTRAGEAAPGPSGGPLATARPGVRVKASPRRIVRGRPTRVRFRLTSSDPACVRGATVRVGRRSTRTGAAGRARMVVLVRWFKRPSVRVDTPCGRAFTTLYGLPW